MKQQLGQQERQLGQLREAKGSFNLHAVAPGAAGEASISPALVHIAESKDQALAHGL